jgi:hypothetical protein
MKLIRQYKRKEADDSTYQAAVYEHVGWKEFFVRYWINGKYLTTRAFGPERQDAIDSADSFVNMEK